MNLLSRIACLACVLAVAGCTGLAARPLPPKVQVESVRSIIVSNNDLRFRIGLIVSNPNPYDVPVRTIEADLRVEDQPIAMAHLPDPVLINAAGDTRVEIEARPDFNALGKALEHILRRFAVRYEVTGFALLATSDQGGTRLPFSRRGELPLSDFVGRLR